MWFRRGRLVIFTPDSRRSGSPLSGRKSTYPAVQIPQASSPPRTVFGSLTPLQMNRLFSDCPRHQELWTYLAQASKSMAGPAQQSGIKCLSLKEWPSGYERLVVCPPYTAGAHCQDILHGGPGNEGWICEARYNSYRNSRSRQLRALAQRILPREYNNLTPSY
jgi:hypothetical protein